MRIKRVKKESGFSLIEVTLAVALLAVGLLAVGSGEIATFTLNMRTSETMRAVAAAEDIIELMRRNPADINAYNGMNTNDDAAAPLTDANIGFNVWKSQVAAIANPVANPVAYGGVPLPAFNCGGVLVTKACGSIVLATGATSAITGVTTVTVTIVWPARPNGFTLSTTIVS